jgi:ribonucleotide reductase beta subunit family protein with ferritin-like domain
MSTLDETNYDSGETILTENPNRYVMFPIQFPKIWAMYKKALSSFWVVEEVSLKDDLDHWKKLDADEQHFIKHVLAFFAASDGMVLENVLSRFTTDVQIPEARAFYANQGQMETIHSEMYSLLIDTYISDAAEKSKLFSAIHNFVSIKKKAEWAIKWIDDKNASFAKRLMAFAIVEGVFFSGSFASIFWLNQRGVMPGLCYSNELIARDEGMHTDFAVELYSTLKNRLPVAMAHDIFREAVGIEKEFITEALPCSLLGMNNALMCQYVEFVADRLLVQLGYEKLYNAENPFDFMELISIKTKTNFFEGRVAEYRRSDVIVDGDADDNEFGLDGEF